MAGWRSVGVARRRVGAVKKSRIVGACRKRRRYVDNLKGRPGPNPNRKLRTQNRSFMSILRSAARALRPVPARHFTTSTGGPTNSPSSNLPFYLGGAGLAGLAGYVYLRGTTSTPAPASSSTATNATTSALDPERFLDLKLKAIEPHNHNTSRFVLELPGGPDAAALSPITSLVVVRASEGAAGAPLDKKGNLAVRPYTPISRPEHEGEIVLLIKKYEKGVVSKYVHEQLKPGDTLAVKGPITKFPYKRTRPSPYIPLPSPCDSHANPPQKTKTKTKTKTHTHTQRTNTSTWRS